MKAAGREIFLAVLIIMNAAKIVSSAIIGADTENIIVGGQAYIVNPPTVRKLAGAGFYMADLMLPDEVNLIDVLKSLGTDNAAHALSWFVAGDESLTETFLDAPFSEVVDGLTVVYSLISTENFLRLSTLAKNVGSLIARQKQ